MTPLLSTWLDRIYNREMPRWIHWITLVALSLGTVRSEAKIVYVNVNLTQPAATNGTTWETAFPSVTPALAAAGDGDQVWVAAGVYPQTNAIVLPSGVALYGGFAGTETNLEQRNWSVNQTMLAGTQKASVVKITQGNTGTRVDGFIITGGQAPSGGGIYCSGGAPVIANNRVYGNVAQMSGAGVYCSSASALITNNIIAGNCANPAPSTFLLGGGIYTLSGSPTIVDNLVSGNAATTGGGLFISGNSGFALVLHNVICGNSATVEGGGVCLSSPSRVIANAIIHNGIVTSKQPLLYGGGGLSLFSTTNTVVANNLIKDNTLPAGAKMKGSAILVATECRVQIANNTVLNNSGGAGGSLVFLPAPGDTNSALDNNLIAFNASGIEANDILRLDHNCVFANGTNDFIGLPSPIGSSGNISANPLLIPDSNAVAVLLPLNSPCRNAGSNDRVIPSYNDLFGHVRIVDGQVDIGAQEIDASEAINLTPIIRVSPSGDDSNDGSTWDKCMRHVQFAIDSLKLTGGEIWTQEGTYNEKILPDMFVHLYGGFHGTETTRAQRNWLQHASVLDGRNSGTVVTIFGVGRLSTLDGFTICNGNGGMGLGGGILIDACSPSIAHNLITNNVAFSGGGISVNNESTAVIEGNRITHNRAYRTSPKPTTSETLNRGGGIHIDANSLFPNVIIRNNLITDNVASGGGVPIRGGYGGGIYFCGSGQILNNTFLRNLSLFDGTNNPTSDNGGQLYWEFGRILTVPNGILNNVFSEMNSGIVFGTMQDQSVVISRNVFNGTNAAAFVSPSSYFDVSSNRVADPMLVEANGIPSPLPGSPCINAGDNAVVGDMTTDLAGNPRLSGGTVDIGAIEYQTPALRIQSVQATPDGLLHFEASGPSDIDCVLQSTTNFLNWDDLSTNRTAAFLVPIPLEASPRFFRILQYR